MAERREVSLRLLVFAAAVAVAGYLASELWLLGRLGFPLDDSWIHLQFAKNLAAGHGLEYTAGERVTGSTAPLWTALLSILFLLPGNVVAWTKLVGIGFHLGGIALVYRLTRALGWSTWVAALATAWSLLAYWMAWSAVSGMEIPLFVVLSLGGMLLQIRERHDPARPPLALPVLAISALARPEGYLLCLLAVLDGWILAPSGERARRLRNLAVGLGVAALCVVPVWLVYARIGGSPLPTTFGAKTGTSRGLPDLQYLFLVFGILFRPLPVASLLAAGGALQLAARRGEAGDPGLLPALWLAALPLAYATLAPQGRHLLLGNFGRYFFPLLPVVAVLGAGAVAEVADRLRATTAGRLAAAVGIALVLAPSIATLVQGAARYAQNVANVEDSDVAMANWLRARLSPEAVLAVQDIGVFGFFLPQRLVDVSGIVSPRVQRLVRESVSREDPFGVTGMRRFLEEEKPDYLIAFPAWYPALVEGAEFRPVHRLRFDDNITMAGNELVVYATPWTRYPLVEPAVSSNR